MLKVEFVKSKENQLNKELVPIQEAAIAVLTAENKALREAIAAVVREAEKPHPISGQLHKLIASAGKLAGIDNE